MSLNLDDANEEMYYKKYLKYKEKYIKLVAEEQAAGAGAVESPPAELTTISADALSTDTINNLKATYNEYVRQYNYTLLVNKNNTYKAEQTVLTNKLTALEHKKETLTSKIETMKPVKYKHELKEIEAADKTATERNAILTKDIEALNITMNADPYSGIEPNLNKSEIDSRDALLKLTDLFKFNAPIKQGIFSRIFGKKK